MRSPSRKVGESLDRTGVIPEIKRRIASRQAVSHLVKGIEPPKKLTGRDNVVNNTEVNMSTGH